MTQEKKVERLESTGHNSSRSCNPQRLNMLPVLVNKIPVQGGIFIKMDDDGWHVYVFLSFFW